MRISSALERLATTRSVLPVALGERLGRPVRPFAILMGWIGSTVTFLLVATALGGPTEGDSAEVVYGTWAIAHGRLSCVYPVVAPHLPPGLADPFALAAPLYPLLAGVVAAILRVGHAVAFPGSGALGPNCVHGYTAMYHWSARSSAIVPTVRIGYVVWIVLLAGVVYLVRATDLRGTGGEVAAGFFVAVTPPVVMCLTYYFHPQDLLCAGLVLLAVGALLRRRYLACGVLVGLALTSQQFAILAAVVLIALVERSGRARTLAGAVAAVVVVDGPFVAVSGLRAVKTVLLGSSRVGSAVAARGGTVLFSAGLRGVPDFLASRVAPIVAAALVAWWVRRSLHGARPSPSIAVAAVTAGLGCRLIFEVNWFGYYLMASVLGIVVLEVLRCQVGRDVVAFLGLFVVAFDPEHIALVSNLTTYGLSLYYDLPIVVLGLGVAVLIYDAVRRRLSIGLVAWIALVALAGEAHLWHRYNPILTLPQWVWQILLVGYAGVILARRLGASLGAGESLPALAHT